MDALNAFFTESYAPHGFCLLWQPALIWTHVGADALIAFAYFSIPLALIKLVRSRRDIEFGGIFWLFALFILACGATHLMSIWTLWHGDYGAEAVVKVITAAASIGTALVLWPLIPKLVDLPSPTTLRAANTRLAETIGERDAALVSMREEIAHRERAEAALLQSQKLEAMGQLTGGIAHDFNNLLQAVGGNLELIAQRPEDAVRVTRWTDNALRGVERGRRLTSQLLAFSRVQKLNLSSVPLRPLLAGMTEMLSRSLGPLTRLDIAMPDDGLAAIADPLQLELAILNLAINARDAMPDGGTVRISARRMTGSTGTDLPAGDYLAIEVSDTGSGMSPETLARAAEPFFTTKDVGKGTGLGLSMVYGVTSQSGGAVSIVSAPGQGTTVRLVLRRAEAVPPLALADAPPIPPMSLAGRTIVLIDDDDDVREIFADVITAAGATVHNAADGVEGLRLLATVATDLLVVDFAMPGLNGAEVTVRARDANPHLPVLVVSGYADSAALDAVAGEGVIVLRKPCHADTLLETVGRMLAPETV